MAGPRAACGPYTRGGPIAQRPAAFHTARIASCSTSPRTSTIEVAQVQEPRPRSFRSWTWESSSFARWRFRTVCLGVGRALRWLRQLFVLAPGHDLLETNKQGLDSVRAVPVVQGRDAGLDARLEGAVRILRAPHEPEQRRQS